LKRKATRPHRTGKSTPRTVQRSHARKPVRRLMTVFTERYV
jgi:hypothetical protein